MLIIDKQVDYYDCMAYAFGIDKKVVFKRDITTKQLSYDKLSLVLQGLLKVLGSYRPDIKTVDGYKISSNITDMFLVFCGKLYFVKETSKTTNHGLESLTENYYDYNWPEYPKNHYRATLWGNIRLNANLIIELGEYINSPYFLIRRKRDYIELSVPNLKDIDFHTIMDASSCYQEIKMAINETYNVENNMVVIANDDRIKQHGFDIKKSFRKAG